MAKGVEPMIISIIAHLTATLSLFPLLSFVLIYTFTFFMTKSKSSALQWAINMTTLLILISIAVTVQQLWEVNIAWVLMVIIIFLFTALAYLQFMVRGQIDLTRLLRGIIRLSFILFLPIHLVLYIWVVIHAMISASS
jgi:hypothetical protein